MKDTQIDHALSILKLNASTPLNIHAIMSSMPGDPCESTVSRGLRRMRSKGIVTSKRNGGRYVLWSFNSSQPAKVQVSNPGSKGSSRSGYIMCRPDNMPTLCKEIESTVKCFIDTKTKFSAYDVTKDLRSKVSDDAISIDVAETGTVHVGGKDVAKIDHEIVKEAVHDIFHSGEMVGYDRVHNGTHWEYSEAVDPVSVPDDDAPADKDDYDGSPSLG